MQDLGKNGVRGRGASLNTDNRFNATNVKREPAEQAGDDEPKPLLRTEFIRDSAKSIIAENKSPDLPFRYSINPYRGCEHGCAYCYARPTHEYLGFSAGLDFESKILYKDDAPRLLREKLMTPSWKGEHITLSGNTDCYQPVERKMRLTRGCVEVMAEFLNPVAVITKNSLVTRDLDLFKILAAVDAVQVIVSITTLDEDLCGVLEPRTSRPRARLQAIARLAEAGIRVGVNVAPCIPGLTDFELPAILKAAKAHGARFAGYTLLRLPLTVRPIFEQWLSDHRAERKNKVLELIRSIRGGNLNDPRFGSRMRGQGAVADNISQMFKLHTRQLGLNQDGFKLSSQHFRRPTAQLSLF